MKLTKLLIFFLLLSFKGFSQQTSSYTLKYDKTEFCAGSNVFANLKIYNGTGDLVQSDFLKKINIYYKNINGEGKLSIDAKGNIDLLKSNVGSYLVQFNYGTSIFSTKVNLINCK